MFIMFFFYLKKWAIRSFPHFGERMAQVAHLLIFSQKNEWFTQKPDERIPNSDKA